MEKSESQSQSNSDSSSSSEVEQKDDNQNDEGMKDKKENRIEKLVNKNGEQDKTKNLHENIGTRVSKLREINDVYERKIFDQEKEIKKLDKQIAEKRRELDWELRSDKEKRKEIKSLEEKLEKKKKEQKQGLAEEKEIKEIEDQIEIKKKECKIGLHDPKFVENLYKKLLEENKITMKINKNHIQNDPALKKAYQQKESELSQLKNHLNNLIKKTDYIKNEINVLRIENNKHKNNLDLILEKKEKQNKEMNKISEEANRYLLKKGTINEELIQLNKKIDAEKIEHESKMQELNKMIDNTKKIKEFHETLACEKFSNSSFRKSNYAVNGKKPTSKMAEEQNKLKELEVELMKTKRKTVFLNFSKLILLKKQIELNEIIERVKKETGIDNLDKLSSDLQLSTKTNTLFESDLKELKKQKEQLEENIEKKKKEIQDAYCVLNDTSTKKKEYLQKLQDDLEKEENKKENLNKRLFTLNRMIDLMSKGFKNICEKLNFFDKSLTFDSETSEGTLTKCMDFLERKMIEIIQLNTDPLKDANIGDNDETKNLMMSIKKTCDGLNHEDHDKKFDKKKPKDFNLEEIKLISKEMVKAYMKKGLEKHG